MKQIGTDFEGWPINVYTLREILHKLGFREDNPGEFITEDSELLNSYPLTYEDDGMAYGINPMFITETDTVVYEDEVSGLKVFNLFREKYKN